MPRNGKSIPSDNPIAQEMMNQTGLNLSQIAWRHNSVTGGIQQAQRNIEAVLKCVSATEEAKHHAHLTLDALVLLKDSLKKRKDQQ